MPRTRQCRRKVKMARKRRSAINPLWLLIIFVLLAVVVTLLVVYFSGYRYISIDGIKFIGKVENGQPISGKITYADGSEARLDFMNSKITYANGDEYTGTIVGVKRHGKGKMTFYLTGDMYEGDFDDNFITGSGKYTYKNGDYYEGQLFKSKKQGKGKCVWANGASYEGDYLNNMANGYGIYTWSDGSYYEGQFENDMRHGQGKRYFANGNYYEGSFIYDVIDGEGYIKFSNGETYTGAVINGLMDTRSRNQTGEFKVDSDGKYVHEKTAVYTWPSGRVFTGYFEEGEIVIVEENQDGES